MLYMFTIIVAIMDSVLASGQPFYRMSDAKVQHWQSEIKRMEKRESGVEKTKVNHTMYAVHLKMAL